VATACQIVAAGRATQAIVQRCPPAQTAPGARHLTVASRSSSLLAVMKRRATIGYEPVQHKMYMTDVDHGSTGFYTALIVLAVPTIPARPGVCPCNHPAFLQRCEAAYARRTRLHCDTPARPIHGQPGVQGMVVILLICKDRDETGKVLRRDEAK